MEKTNTIIDFHWGKRVRWEVKNFHGTHCVLNASIGGQHSIGRWIFESSYTLEFFVCHGYRNLFHVFKDSNQASANIDGHSQLLWFNNPGVVVSIYPRKTKRNAPKSLTVIGDFINNVASVRDYYDGLSRD